MKKYVVQSVASLSPSTVLLTLSPDDDADALQFWPGQYATISMRRGLRPTPTRCFSIVSAPNERQMLQFAMRVDGRFTRAAARLRAGDVVTVQGPFGEFVIDEQYDRSVVMLAGGIGITPFISMLRAAKAQKSQLPITLLYGCRSQADIPFFEELVRLEQASSNVRVVFFVADGAVREVPGAQLVAGKIDEAWIQRVTRGTFVGSTYFLCGPKGFMRGMEKSLLHNGVHQNRILTESFTQAATPVLGGRISLQTLTYVLSALVLVAGVGSIMTLDLMRNVPHTASAQAVTTSTSSGDDATSTTPTTSATSSGGTSTAPTATTPTYQYQQPMSSVS